MTLGRGWRTKILIYHVMEPVYLCVWYGKGVLGIEPKVSHTWKRALWLRYNPSVVLRADTPENGCSGQRLLHKNKTWVIFGKPLGIWATFSIIWAWFCSGILLSMCLSDHFVCLNECMITTSPVSCVLESWKHILSNKWWPAKQMIAVMRPVDIFNSHWSEGNNVGF